MASRYISAKEALQRIMESDSEDHASEPEDESSSDEDHASERESESSSDDEQAVDVAQAEVSTDADENISSSDSENLNDDSPTHAHRRYVSEVGNQCVNYISKNAKEKWLASAPVARQARVQNIV